MVWSRLNVLLHGFAAVLALLMLVAGTGDAFAKRGPRIKGSGETLALEAFRKRHKLSVAEMQGLLGAVGRLRCSWGVATAFLVGGADVVVTSGHLFVDMEHGSRRKGRSRGNARTCAYYPLLGKGRYRLVAGSLIEGPRALRRGAEFYWTDWAVGRLDRGVKGARPFLPGALNVQRGRPALVVSQGMNDSITRICSGAIDSVTRARDLLSFTTTCDSGPGASGGPVIAADLATSRGGELPVIGLTLGWTGETPSDARHLALPVEAGVIGAVARSVSDPRTALDLAAFYRSAPGPPQQMMDAARALYLIAAQRGERSAYHWLGQLHFNVLGILPNDDPQAFGWLELAVAELGADATLVAEARRLLDSLSLRLSAEQKQSGRRMVADLLAAGG